MRNSLNFKTKSFKKKALCSLLFIGLFAMLGTGLQAQVIVTNFPYIIDFENSGNLPADVTLENTGYMWSINSGETATGNTGPSGDNTQADGSGFYLYAEASAPADTGETGTFISPMIDISSLVNPEVAFAYHMSGNNIGTLDIEVINGAGTVTNIFGLIGEQQANVSDPYLNASVDLASFAGQTIQLRIVATRGNGSFGDIAIDDILIVDASTVDLGIISVDVPSVSLENMDNIFSMNITNLGLSPETNFDVTYLAEGNLVTETFTGIINPTETATHTFTAPFVPSTTGDFVIDFAIILPTDQNMTNNTAQTTTTVVPVINTFPYNEDFELGSGGWTTDGDLWERGLPAGDLIIGAASGTNAWATDLDEDYPTDAFEILLSPVFDFSNFTVDPTMNFDIWYDSEFSWDGTVLESTIDAGTTWVQVGAFSDPNNWYTDNTISGLSNGGATGEGWTGSDATGLTDYIEATHMLDALAGESAVQLRFVFGSDAATVDDGVAIDNIFVGIPPLSTTPPITEFPYLESFEDGNGGWMTDGFLWELGTPANDVIIGASDGVNAWITDLDDNYTSNAFESMVSPIFDFSGITEDPTITMDVWWNIEFSWDGVVLQSTIDAGTTWIEVGAFGDTDNWYTDDTITGLSEGSPTGNGEGATGEGWTGRDMTGNGSSGYVEAVHALDGLAGQSAVQLRVLFGSDASEVDNGFAFDNIRIVTDVTGPTITGCPEDLDVNQEGNATVVLDDFTTIVTVSDNSSDVGDITIVQDPIAGTVLNAGTVQTVTLTATDISGNATVCTFDVTVLIVLSVNDQTLENAISVYPNPAIDFVTIAYSGTQLITQISIIDVNGRIIQTISNDNVSERQINIQGYTSGVYFARIETATSSTVKRIIKR